jgi:hypothetical protein
VGEWAKAMYEVIRWILSVLLGIPFLVIAVFNWSTVLRKSVEGPSPAPFIGGAFGVASFFLCPLEKSAWYVLIPLLADYGSLPYFVLVLREIFSMRRRS